MASLARYLHLAAVIGAAAATTIAQINGNAFLSPLNGESVSNVSGIVTAKGPDGLWLRSTAPDSDARTSESLYVYGADFGANLTVGDAVVVEGEVQEYRSNSDYVYLTELTSPVLASKLSSNNTVAPLVIGADTSAPPTEQFSGLDGGHVFAVPNNQSLISVQNPELEPGKYGMDFWESLSGELVTVKAPTVLTKPNQYGDTWVVGDWEVSGRNERGGLTMTDKDANPEAIIIGSPLDGSDNPSDSKMGDKLDNITGIVTYAFGFYRILPHTALRVTESVTPALPNPTTLLSTGSCNGITFGVYNVENLTPDSDHMAAVAAHIADYLHSPDMLFLQEVQDNNGATNDDVVSANLTLSVLASSIAEAGGANYAFTEIAPEDDQDGGEPGGNIRVAYLYNPTLLRLYKPNPGNATAATEVIAGPALTFNPGRIDPQNEEAWSNSRKPLVAQWEVLASPPPTNATTATFFTVNTHFASKGGSSSLHGDARPPVNGGVDDRRAQASVTAAFVAEILAADPDARIITAGDFNEFAFVAPLREYAAESGLRDLDAVVGVAERERYTYLYDMNAQELDHVYVSEGVVAGGRPQFEHVHVNTWVEYGAQVSDHDPSVGRVGVCA